MSYTKEQESIVLKVLSYKPHQFYEILQVEKSASDSEIKKSYRKLAIKLHPDKNPHPRSSEAFKYLNKAWGVLGDETKKRIYDQTGSDPDSRFAGYDNSEASASGVDPRMFNSPFGGGFGGGGYGGGGSLDEELFNLFFGGAGRGAQAFTFGNNGFTFQTFGNGPSHQHPFFTSTGGRTGRAERQRQRTQPPENVSVLDTIKQLAPLLLFLLVPIFSAIFSDNSSPEYSFNKTSVYNSERSTPRYKVPYYVAKDFERNKDMTKKQIRQFGLKVENLYIQDKKSRCSREQTIKNEMIEDAHGWFFTDEEKLRQAQELPMPNCEALRNLNLI